MNNRRRAMMHKDSGRDYLCFTALEEGTFTFMMVARLSPTRFTYASYSIDGGKTWVTVNNKNNTTVRLTTPTIKPGGRVLWKGKGTATTSGSINTSLQYCGRFQSNCRFVASGNVLSLIKENTFENETVIPTNGFANLFYNSNIVKASVFPKITLGIRCYSYMFEGCTSLVEVSELPSISVAQQCYSYMFEGCTSLTTAPTLPATELVSRCYEGMFNGCTSLNHVKAMFTTEPSDDYTLDWLNGVAANGTFVKNSAAEWTNRGTNAVPENWTIQTANK